MSIEAKLEGVVSRYEEIRARMTDPDLDPRQFQKFAKEFSDLEPIVASIRELTRLRAELGDLGALVADAGGDAEMRAMAESEFFALKTRLPDLERELQIMLLPKDAADEKNAILEVRAGTGGDEAALFAAELFRMYQRYATVHGWRFEMMEYTETGLGGLKEGIANISGRGVFARLKYESGVHRVQRVPATEGSGRIHTSAATVAVLPEAEEVDIRIEDKDLRIDVFRAQGAGGQHVNTTDSAVRVTHLPTGLAVAQQEEKSQHKNKAKALKILRARLYELERGRQDAARAADRKSQVGSGDRSERIRTYNFPQNRVTDHRINLSLYKLEQVMTGEALDEVIDALITEDRAARLAEMPA